MSWWQAVVATGVGGALTALGGYLVFWQQERTRRREQAASFVGAALAALRDLGPATWTERLQRHALGQQMLTEKRTRWQAAAGGLEVLAAMHPGTEIADLCEAVIKRGDLVLIRVDEAVQSGEYPSSTWWDVVENAHSLAVSDARRLVRLAVRN